MEQLVARRAHNPKVVGSSPASATKNPLKETSEGFFVLAGKGKSRIMLDKNRLRIAIQKSGRLSKDSQQMLKDCGLKINMQIDFFFQ